MCFFGECENVTELKQKVKELEKQLELSKKETFNLKWELDKSKTYFIMSNLSLLDIKVGSKLVNVGYGCNLKTKDFKPYNRIVGMVGDKYTIFDEDGHPTKLGLVQEFSKVIDYVITESYIVCEI